MCCVSGYNKLKIILSINGLQLCDVVTLSGSLLLCGILLVTLGSGLLLGLTTAADIITATAPTTNTTTIITVTIAIATTLSTKWTPLKAT